MYFLSLRRFFLCSDTCGARGVGVGSGWGWGPGTARSTLTIVEIDRATSRQKNYPGRTLLVFDFVLHCILIDIQFDHVGHLAEQISGLENYF